MQKFFKRFIPLLTAFVILFSCFVPLSASAYAESDFVFPDSSLNSDSVISYNFSDDLYNSFNSSFISSFNLSLDDCFYLILENRIFYLPKSDFSSGFTFSIYSDGSYVFKDFYCICFYSLNCSFSHMYGEGNRGELHFFISSPSSFYGTAYYPGRSPASLSASSLRTNIFQPFSNGSFSFNVDPEFTSPMEPQSGSFTVNVSNTTDHSYDYMLYVSRSPSAVGVSSSLKSANWIMSSRQWCYQYINQSAAMSLSDLYNSVADYFRDSFGDSLFDAFGNLYDISKLYYTSQNDTFSYYSLSQVDRCPVHHISANSECSYVINYSSLGLKKDTLYYFNIVYYDVSEINVSPTTFPIYDAAGVLSSYPYYDTNLFSSYTSYSSTQFIFLEDSDINFVQNGDDTYNYTDVIKNSDPSSSTATISADDNSVNVNNNSSSVDNSTSRYNYGNVYNGNVYVYYTYDYSTSSDSHNSSNDNYYYGTSSNPVDVVNPDGTGILNPFIDNILDFISDLLGSDLPVDLIDLITDFISDSVSTGMSISDLIPHLIDGIFNIISSYVGRGETNITIPDDFHDNLTVFINDHQSDLERAHNYVCSSLNYSYVGLLNYGTVNNINGSGSGGSDGGFPPVFDYDFSDFESGSSGFMDFFHFVIDHLPEEFAVMFLAALAVAIMCRIWGR